MSLLEKASGGKKNKVAPSQADTSLFKRAMAASRAEASTLAPETSSSIEERDGPAASGPEPEAILQSRASSPFLNLAWDDLRSRLTSLPPYSDSILAAWSILSTSLPFEALSLFLPHGDFLAPAAQIGFPEGTCDDVPPSIAPLNNGTLLDDEAKALIAPSLGVSVGMNMRAVSMHSESGLVGLWVYHDDSLESSPEEIRSQVSELLAEASASLPACSMVFPSPDPVSLLLPKLKKYSFATPIRYDVESIYADGASYRGISTKALLSAFVAASEKILEQAGVVLAFGQASFVCVLGSSARRDPELALFQFTKTLKRSLPFLSAGVFPEGSATSFDLSSDLVSEELSRFLAT
jgi:hypothetical protein